jgi:flagellar biosynthetic protein FliP
MQRGLKSLGMISLIGVLALSSLVNATVAHAQSPVSGTTGVTASAMVTATTVAQQTPTTPSVSLQFGSGEDSDFRVSGTVGTVLFMGLLATLPTLLLLMTSFTRVLVVLHFARQALGTQGAPPAHLLAALALLMTGFIMAPTIGQANDVALQPWMRGEIDEVQMMKAGVEPFRTFMLGQTTDDELARFVEMSGQPLPDTPEEVSLPVLMTAFATGELRAAFQMGFAIFLPFVVIDLVVSAVLTSMGMFMLPPTMIALPIKLLLFVLVDGWSLLVGSLISSFV